MRTDTAQPVRLSDYRAPDFLIDRVELDVALHLTRTHIQAKLHIRPNPAGRAGTPLILNGDGLEATSLLLNGQQLDLKTLPITPDRLELTNAPSAPFTLEIGTLINPSTNTQLMGLYRSLCLLHAMRGGRLSADHLLSRPTRCAERLHDPHRRGSKGSAYSPWQRKPRRSRRN